MNSLPKLLHLSIWKNFIYEEPKDFSTSQIKKSARSITTYRLLSKTFCSFLDEHILKDLQELFRLSTKYCFYSNSPLLLDLLSTGLTYYWVKSNQKAITEETYQDLTRIVKLAHQSLNSHMVDPSGFYVTPLFISIVNRAIPSSWVCFLLESKANPNEMLTHVSDTKYISLVKHVKNSFDLLNKETKDSEENKEYKQRYIAMYNLLSLHGLKDVELDCKPGDEII